MEDLVIRIRKQITVEKGVIELLKEETKDYEKILPMLSTDGAIDQIEHLIEMNERHINCSYDEIHRMETIISDLEELDDEFAL